LIARGALASFAGWPGMSLERTKSFLSTGNPPLCDCIILASLRASTSASSSEAGLDLRLRVAVEVAVDAGARELEAPPPRTARGEGVDC